MLSCSIPFVHYEHNLFISRPNHDSDRFSHRKITSSGWKSTVCLLQYLCFMYPILSTVFSELFAVLGLPRVVCIVEHTQAQVQERSAWEKEYIPCQQKRIRLSPGVLLKRPGTRGTWL